MSKDSKNVKRKVTNKDEWESFQAELRATLGSKGKYKPDHYLKNGVLHPQVCRQIDKEIKEEEKTDTAAADKVTLRKKEYSDECDLQIYNYLILHLDSPLCSGRFL